ncbi:Kelch repeat-containing protein [Flammeovirga aprica]|uniref:Attractin/MKLN-like beta-propeller domain-containing protein n=1 Tax=Flammeovirga aprica JL-4 TaxID=694437 RepID=A0A7X9RXS8_9BACT|nr:kelch repeat-containing protein [Flammeovirga aprica]NME70695.1 hypothetical protein [Flammeovirga aprica JL-4]
MRKRLTLLLYYLLSSMLAVAQLAHTNHNTLSSKKGQVLEFKDQNQLLSPRLSFGYTNDANYIYMASGVTENKEFVSTIERYNPEDNSWEELSKKLTPLQYASLSINEDKLYVIGGVTKGGKVNSKVIIYDLKTGKFSKGLDQSSPTASCGSAVWGGQIYIFGGSYDKTFYSKTLKRYDPKTNTWEKLANMPEKKSTKGEIIDGKLYTIGGYNGKKASNSVDVYDISSDKWGHVFDLPVEVSAHATAVIDGKIWIVGNYNEESYLASIDPINKIYIEYNSNMKVSRHGGCAYINNELYIFGGIKSTTGKALSSLQKLEM